MIDLNTPLKIKTNLKLKNRVIVPPMASATADSNGHVTLNTLEHYRRLTESGASLVMVEYTYVHQTGKSEPNQLGIQSNSHISGLKALAEAIQESGATAGIQLTHAGAKTDRITTGGPLISPSGISVPVREGVLETPDIATDFDIKLLKQSFLDSAIRADEAGFEVIELHSAHGYGLNQWLSPLTNNRLDQYGGNIFNRSRLLLEIVESIKIQLPEMALSIRVPGMDHFPGGLSHQDMILVVKELESIGADIINVSSGIGGWRRPRNRVGEGYLVPDAFIIQQQTSLPVVGVGGIETANYINESLQQKQFSLAAVGRSILTNPHWGTAVGLIRK